MYFCLKFLPNIVNFIIMKALYLIGFLFLSSTLFCQITVNPTSLSTTIDYATGEYVDTIYVTNAGSTAVNLWWKLTIGNIPADWQIFLCDLNLCYSPGVIQTPASKPNVMPANSTQKMTLHWKPQNTVGQSTLGVQFYSDKLFQKLEAQTDLAAIIIAEQSLSTEAIIKDIDIKVFPNPATSYFKLMTDVKFSTLTIFDLFGREVQNYTYNTANSYDVSSIKKGIYYIKLIDDKGNSLNSGKLNLN